MHIGNTINLPERQVHISMDDRRRHVYLVGMSGTGKSSLLTRMAEEEIAAGDGLCFVDPHGDTARGLLDRIPAKRIADVIYLNHADRDHPVGFNPLQCADASRRALIADDVVSAFRHVFADSWGPRLEHFLLNACRALLEQPEATLLGIPLLFLDSRFRGIVTKRISDPVVRMFWELEYPTYSDRLLSDALSPILNKINRVLSSPDVRNILCQPQSTIDLRTIMDEGKILVVNLSKGGLGEGNAHLLGALIVNSIAQAALAREDMEPEQRRTFHLYVDEFQNFATESFGLILSEARKYKLTLTLAHQYLAQVPDSLREAAFGNCGSFISLRCGAEDAPLIARHLTLENPENLLELPDYQAIGRFLTNGRPSNTERMTLPPPQPCQSHAPKIIRQSRHRWTKERARVEEKIERFLGGRQSGKKMRRPREQWG